jgi:hypothetical protein
MPFFNPSWPAIRRSAAPVVAECQTLSILHEKILPTREILQKVRSGKFGACYE